MNEMAKPPVQRNDEAFKRQAVEHWLVSGKFARPSASQLNKSVHLQPMAPDQSPVSNQKSERGINPGTMKPSQFNHASIFSCANENALALVR